MSKVRQTNGTLLAYKNPESISHCSRVFAPCSLFALHPTYYLLLSHPSPFSYPPCLQPNLPVFTVQCLLVENHKCYATLVFNQLTNLVCHLAPPNLSSLSSPTVSIKMMEILSQLQFVALRAEVVVWTRSRVCYLCFVCLCKLLTTCVLAANEHL